jgi:hypothetical protein
MVCIRPIARRTGQMSGSSLVLASPAVLDLTVGLYAVCLGLPGCAPVGQVP